MSTPEPPAARLDAAGSPEASDVQYEYGDGDGHWARSWPNDAIKRRLAEGESEVLFGDTYWRIKPFVANDARPASPVEGDGEAPDPFAAVKALPEADAPDLWDPNWQCPEHPPCTAERPHPTCVWGEAELASEHAPFCNMAARVAHGSRRGPYRCPGPAPVPPTPSADLHTRVMEAQADEVAPTPADPFAAARAKAEALRGDDGFKKRLHRITTIAEAARRESCPTCLGAGEVAAADGETEQAPPVSGDLEGGDK